MKLAIIDQSFHWPPTGGSWVDVRETALRLKKHGIDVCIFVPEWNHWNLPSGVIEEDPGIPVKTFPLDPKRQFNFRYLPKLFANAVRPWNPDGIWITNTFYLAPYIIRQFTDIPVYLRIFAHELVCLNYMNVSKVNVHNWVNQNPTGATCDGSVLKSPWMCWRCALRRLAPTLWGPRLDPVSVEYWTALACIPGYHRMLRRALNQLSGIMVYNPSIRSLFHGIKPPVHIVPGGVDPDAFHPDGPAKSHSSTRTSPVRILMSGRADDQRKGFSVFKSAIETLTARNLPFKAYVTDPRPDFSVSGIESVGWVSGKALAELYRSMDVIVCPTIWPEPFGLIVLESMASGTPVIASRIGGMAFTVDHGETGYTFPPGDSEALANHLHTLIDHPEIRVAMGSAGRRRIIENFTWDSIVENYTLPILSGNTASPLNWIEGLSDHPAD